MNMYVAHGSPYTRHLLPIRGPAHRLRPLKRSNESNSQRFDGKDREANISNTRYFTKSTKEVPDVFSLQQPRLPDSNYGNGSMPWWPNVAVTRVTSSSHSSINIAAMKQIFVNDSSINPCQKGKITISDFLGRLTPSAILLVLSWRVSIYGNIAESGFIDD